LMEKSKDQLILDSLREGRKQWTDLERELVKSEDVLGHPFEAFEGFREEWSSEENR
jgi:hypothetical protein